ncbi:MAG: ATP-dependent DNA helicase RecG [Rhodobacteraceae bacterium]|nr:ATP-dependent DNA helicase RecG [Paracoccaceae bacterium]
MPGRPEILFPLFAPLDGLAGIGPRTAKHLEQLGVKRPRDLLFTLPRSVLVRREITSISEGSPQEPVSIKVEVGSHQPGTRKGLPYRVWVHDGRQRFQLVFFNAHKDWLEKNLPVGQQRIVSGKIEEFNGLRQIVHPDHIRDPGTKSGVLSAEPVYPLVSGLTQKMMNRSVSAALERTPDLPEWISPEMLTSRGWPSWRDALTLSHSPRSEAETNFGFPPLERLSFDEMFAHQLTLALARSRLRQQRGRSNHGDGRLAKRVLSRLPFTLTKAQRRSIGEINQDMARTVRMNRLLQGDVGSGKTIVAFLALLNAVEAGGQGVLMAPTEVLVRQHHDKLKPLARSAGLNLARLTSRDKGRERNEKLDMLKAGDIQVLVGTHAVFQKGVEFSDLRLAVIDEQHRFGVKQRLDLSAKGDAIDVMVMSATPIPRSLALACYGDMSVSILDEKPPGRRPVKTAIASRKRMASVINRLKSAVDSGRQAYWICPLVEESGVSTLTPAENRYSSLRAVLGNDAAGLVHGQMSPAERDTVFDAFTSGTIRVLVATTVVEVGIDVPNATIMIIEHAENFGLAQLHQLRGRVGRGRSESSCLLLFGEPISSNARRRLEIIQQTEDGFRIAEEDLAMRGAGDLLGVHQSGLPEFRIADIENQGKLLRDAHKEARAFLECDPDLRTDRGQAVRTLLHLMEVGQSVRLISVG